MTRLFHDRRVHSPEKVAIREKYVRDTVRGYYEKHGSSYRNPHEPQVRRAIIEAMDSLAIAPGRVLDLACGSGEASLALVELGWSVYAVDPYSGAAFRERLRLDPEPLSFEEIAAGLISDRRYDLIVCSYAMHLVPLSRLPLLAFRLKEISPLLMTVSPHKRPSIKQEWGWSQRFQFVKERVRVAVYDRTT